MGLIIDSHIETNHGPTKELYFRIDSYKINKTVGDITFTTTSWLNKDHTDRFLRNYYNEPLKSAIGLVSSKIVYYADYKKEGEEFNIDNLYKVPMYEEVEVEEPSFETKEVSKEVPYVSFDENGEEITLYHTVTKKEKVKTGTKKTLQKVMNYSIIDQLEEFCYNHLKGKLAEYFPDIIINKV